MCSNVGRSEARQEQGGAAAAYVHAEVDFLLVDVAPFVQAVRQEVRLVQTAREAVGLQRLRDAVHLNA